MLTRWKVMKKKFDLSAFSVGNWWYYVLFLLLVIFVWECVFSIITKPKDEESIYLFFGVENARTEDMYADLDSVKPEYVKYIDITSYSARISSFDALFVTRGQSQSDIFVLPESYCEPSVMRSTFYPMDLSVVKEVFGEDVECDKATYAGKVYGVKMYDKETNTGRASEYFVYTYSDDNGAEQSLGDYYLFFGKKSLHLGKLSGGELNGALVLAQAVWNM